MKNMAGIILGFAACAMLLGAADGPETQIITRGGLKQMLADPGTEPVGARKPDVVIVEYYDYNCPYCKKLVPALQGVLAQDPKVAVIYKDWPILSAVSKYAASSALAAGYQGKFLAAHDALISGPRLAQNAQVDAVLLSAGVNIDTLNKDRAGHAQEIAALLARNDQEAHALTLQGTPGLVVGRQLVFGIVDQGELSRLVANARKAKDK
jgi:protein-disulfide isomerase